MRLLLIEFNDHLPEIKRQDPVNMHVTKAATARSHIDTTILRKVQH